MKHESFIQHLTHIGFPEKEARVYLACLEAGTASVAAVAEIAGVKRPTAYVMLKALAEKGLVEPAQGVKKGHVCVLAPSKILDMIEAQRRDAERKHKVFSAIMPELLAAHGESK